MKLLLATMLLVSAFSCTNDPPVSPQTARPHQGRPAGPDPALATAPFVVKVEGPPAPPAKGTTFDVTIVIDRQVPNSTPMQLRLGLPPGVRLVSGNAAETIISDGDRTIRRTVKLFADETPALDVTATVDVSTPQAGAHAVAAYRFGRPEPRIAEPSVGRPLTVQGHDLGQPIPLAPPVPSK
jgi:hypothetical protein